MMNFYVSGFQPSEWTFVVDLGLRPRLVCDAPLALGAAVVLGQGVRGPREGVHQGLKPRVWAAMDGTAEAVPVSKTAVDYQAKPAEEIYDAAEAVPLIRTDDCVGPFGRSSRWFRGRLRPGFRRHKIQYGDSGFARMTAVGGVRYSDQEAAFALKSGMRLNDVVGKVRAVEVLRAASGSFDCAGRNGAPCFAQDDGVLQRTEAGRVLTFAQDDGVGEGYVE